MSINHLTKKKVIDQQQLEGRLGSNHPLKKVLLVISNLNPLLRKIYQGSNLFLFTHEERPKGLELDSE